ncbi:MAG: hypothetical protein AAFY08_02685 [Planctomycetota bacterium]
MNSRPPRHTGTLLARVGLVLMLVVSASAVSAESERERDGERAEAKRFGPPRAATSDRRDRSAEPRQLSPEEFEIAATMLKNLLGEEAAERMRTAAELDPAAASATIHREFPRLARFLEFRRRDPVAELRWDEVRLAREARQLAADHRQAVAADRPELAKNLAAELRDTLALQFEIRTELREHELARLEQRLGDLRAELAEHAEQRNAMIDQRFAELTDPDRPLEGDRPMGGPMGPPPTRNASDAPATRPAE